MKVAWEVTLPISRTSPISEARTMLRVRHTWTDRPKDWKEKKSDSRNDRSYLQAYSDIGQTDMRTERRRTGWEESKDRVHFLRLYLYQLVSVWNIIILMIILSIIIIFYYTKKYWLSNFGILHNIHPSIHPDGTGSIRIAKSRGRSTLKHPKRNE